MRELKDLMKFALLALLMSLLLFWLSVAVYGWGNWGFVILNVIFFSLFILFTQFKRRVARLPASVYLAFIVALYAEMYGFPLTMYIFMWLFGYRNVYMLQYLLVGLVGEDLFGFIFHLFILPMSNMIILIGILLIIFGWRGIFRAKGQLVTVGIYGHVRHPQYLGFLLITFGMNVQWITIPTLLLWPILVILYYCLAKEEDKKMEDRFGEEYRKYKHLVPMFIPRPRTKKSRAL
jgi:protein-S-isoprenylcysteine O-methyltransferase Ste14